MTTTPQLWKSLTQVNTTDAGTQFNGQIAGLLDGGYVVVWEDDSKTYNPSGDAIIGQRYDAFGNKVGGEVKLSGFITGDQVFPAITLLSNGNIAVAFEDFRGGDNDIYVRTRRPRSIGVLLVGMLWWHPTNANRRSVIGLDSFDIETKRCKVLQTKPRPASSTLTPGCILMPPASASILPRSWH